MFDSDFDASSRRLEEQRKKRAAVLRKKREEDRKKAAIAKALREKEEQQREDRRRKKIEAQEAAEERERLEVVKTGGITYNKKLVVVPSTDTGDKLTLPVSALEAFHHQDALQSNPMTFELTTNFGTRTHAGVREFKATEGTVGLPPKCARSLAKGINLDKLTEIRVKYVKLCKGTFVRLQPLGAGFQNHHINMKDLLEKTLQTHTTLTVGDILIVRYEGKNYKVAIRELRPEPQVLVIDTNMEVDVMLSEAAEKAQREAQEAKKREEELAKAKAEKEAAFKALRKSKKESLPPEPTSTEGTIQFRVKLPSGSHCARRFLMTDPMQTLFDFVIGEGGIEPPFSLVTTFPRRVLKAPKDTTTTTTTTTITTIGASNSLGSFKEYGLTNRQEVVFVQKKNSLSEEEDVEMKGNEEEDEENEENFDMPNPSLNKSPTPNHWKQAEEGIATKLDRVNSGPKAGLIPTDISKSNLSPQEKWASKLILLQEQGFCNVELNIELLERYQGRELRVINAILDMQTN